jgi:eukaryotic-like serine/threonine-protein kinase
VLVTADTNLCGDEAFWWAPDGRLIFSLAEPDPRPNGSNLWGVRLDPRNGKPQDKPARLTNWVGFSFGSPTVSADGKRLAFLKEDFQSNVYVSELKAGGTNLTTPRRLNRDDDNDYPSDWTNDSRAVLFSSDRNGSEQIFKQDIDQQTAETVVAGPGQAWLPRMSPDGISVLYRPRENKDEVGRIMRVRLGGDTPELVMEMPRLSNFACPHGSAHVCFVGQVSEDREKIHFSTFDPVMGKAHEVLTVDIHPGAIINWMPSPEGSRLAFIEFNALEGRIRLLSLKGDPERDFVVKGWVGFNSLDWAADGKSLFVSSHSPTSSTLLDVDLEGHATPLWDRSGEWRVWAIPAPNGRELAIGGITKSSNVWMIENF